MYAIQKQEYQMIISIYRIRHLELNESIQLQVNQFQQ